MAISGQVALDASGALVGGTEYIAQACQCFANICEALAALNAQPRDCLQIRIYVVGQRQDLVSAIFDAGNQAFGGDWPT
ncbi:RidA family protein [Microvirga arsenatis]|uniref:RidA family protein n=1 Tax=Microvirga arsenatis TaxID=2692265 RepID=A0ABW9Z0T8_9HYPH|nr:hypothetical protein [Microvirga arsenatis]NBJ24918.1 hypothetical protein [Microvirga arsenatis]